MLSTVKVNLPLNSWDKASIRPGPVGSVGDALTSVRIKQSMPDMPFAYSKTFGPENDVLRGSNVQDGRWASFVDGGYGAQTKRRKIDNRTSFKTPLGWVHEDAVPPAREVQPKLASQGRVGFNTQAAEILTKSGDMFGDLPGGYKAPAGVLPRGGMMPRTVNQNALDPFDDKQKIFKWDEPIMKKKPLPNVGGLIQSVVANMLPTPANNLNKRNTKLNPDVLEWLDNVEGRPINFTPGVVVRRTASDPGRVTSDMEE